MPLTPLYEEFKHIGNPWLCFSIACCISNVDFDLNSWKTRATLKTTTRLKNIHSILPYFAAGFLPGNYIPLSRLRCCPMISSRYVSFKSTWRATVTFLVFVPTPSYNQGVDTFACCSFHIVGQCLPFFTSLHPAGGRHPCPHLPHKPLLNTPPNWNSTPKNGSDNRKKNPNNGYKVWDRIDSSTEQVMWTTEHNNNVQQWKTHQPSSRLKYDYEE